MENKLKNNSNLDIELKKLKIPPDTYNSSGTHVNELSPEEKKKCLSILKNEFIPN